MKISKYIIPLVAGLLVAGFALAAFPTSLNNWQYGDVITEDWANALESTIGITNSAVVTSHDYMIRDRLTITYASSTYFKLVDATTTMAYFLNATNTLAIDIIGSLTGNADTATALAANPTDCSLGTVANGIAANGNLSCIATSTWDTSNAYTADNPIELNSTVFGINNTSSTNWQTAYGWGDHASSNYLTQAFATTTYFKKSGGVVTATSTFTSTVDFSGGTVTGMFLYPAFTYVTSTWSGTTTIALGTAYVPETWLGVQCFTTAGNVAVRFGDGTNKMNWVLATTTVGQKTLSTNNTFTAQEKRYVELGSPETTPTQVSCTIKKYQ